METVITIQDGKPGQKSQPLLPFREGFRWKIERTIAQARTMTPDSESSDQFTWTYNRGFGIGTYYRNLNHGLCSVSLSCGGEIGQDDISRSNFLFALMLWKNKVKDSLIKNAVLALPRQSDTDIKNEPNIRHYLFYMSTTGSEARIEQIGSAKDGWISVKLPRDSMFRYDSHARDLSATIDIGSIEARVREYQKNNLSLQDRFLNFFS